MFPLIEKIAPEERGRLPAFYEAYSLIKQNPKQALSRLDTLLLNANRPTFFRGMIQFGRAVALATGNDYSAAAIAVDEAIRLLPDEAVAKLAGAQIFTFTGNPGEAADLWLEASRLDPAMTRMMPDYPIMALLGRLDDLRDRRRADLIRARLLEIGFKASQGVRSSMAMSVMRSRMRAHDLVGAQQIIPQLASPEDVALLLADKNFAPLWPNLEAWAGPLLESQWKSYLDPLKRRWEGSRSLDAGLDYANALTYANDVSTIVTEFEPALADDESIKADLFADRLATPLAKALAATNRLDDAFNLYARLANLWPYEREVRGLNISANWAQLELWTGRSQAALDRIDGVIRNASSRGPEVNLAALLGMHAVRTCALHALGRDSEATDSISLITTQKKANPAVYMDILTCSENRQAAKAFLLSLAADPDDYPFALKFVQTYLVRPWQPPYFVAKANFVETLKRDREIEKAISKIGRKLDFVIDQPPRTAQ